MALEPGLLSMLTNPVYIGWWCVEGDIISRDNHERIIPPEKEYLFWYAFEKHSAYTVEGTPNEQRKQYGPRYYQKDTTPVSGLLKKRIGSPHGTVYLHTSDGDGSYYTIYPPEKKKVKQIPLCQIDADIIDDAFSKEFLAHLEETHDFDGYQRWITDVLQKRDEETGLINTQLTVLASEQEGTLSEIIAMRSKINQEAKDDTHRKQLEAQVEPLIQGLRNRYSSLDALKTELTAKLPKPEQDAEFQHIRHIADFQTEVKNLIQLWHKKPFVVKFEFVSLFVEKAELTIRSTHWLQLDVFWTHPFWTPQRFLIHRWRSSNPRFTEEERDILRAHFATTPKDELLPLIPQKSWASISMESRRLGLHREIAVAGSLPKNVSWSDWQFMQKEGIGRHDRTAKVRELCRSL